jgi:amidase
MLLPADPARAFLPYPPVKVAGAPTGPLAGLTLAVKDLYDVAGYPTGCGSPFKLAQSGIKTTTAPAIRTLLDAGAWFVGKAHTDEIAWSILGINAHFGTPLNPAAPDRCPGGSSSGSVAAVAAGMADIGIGSDTGGSVRAPASYCGVLGIRTSHGRVSLDGVMPLAPSFDTFGWFARDVATLARVGDVVLGPDARTLSDRPKLIVAADALEATDADARAAIEPAIALIEELIGPGERAALGAVPLADIANAFRVLQSAEVWQAHGDWYERFTPPLSPGIPERFAFAKALTKDEVDAAQTVRDRQRLHMASLLAGDTVIALPTVHTAAPKLDSTPADFETFRRRALALLSSAGLAGCPQITLPLARIGSAPIGLSLIGPPGSDRSLIALVQALVARA